MANYTFIYKSVSVRYIFRELHDHNFGISSVLYCKVLTINTRENTRDLKFRWKSYTGDGTNKTQGKRREEFMCNTAVYMFMTINWCIDFFGVFSLFDCCSTENTVIEYFSPQICWDFAVHNYCNESHYFLRSSKLI